jgi:hypothetical protein
MERKHLADLSEDRSTKLKLIWRKCCEKV